MKWFLILLFTVQILSQERAYKLEQYEAKLERGDTLIFTNVRKNYYLILALLLSVPSTAQIMISDRGYNPPADVFPPSIPSGLNGVSISDDSLLFYWTNPPEADFNRNVVWFFGALKDSTSNDSIYIGGLSPNTTYGLRVLSVDNSGNRSAYSDSVQRTTLDTTTSTATAPEKPTNLAVSDSTDDITLTWTNNPPNASHIVIMKNSADYDTVAYPIATWSESDTTDGVYYTYKIYAYNAGGESDTTSTVTAERVSINTYYITTSGNDANNGTNPNTAWQTLSKLQGVISSAWSLAGYKIKFKCGDTWTTRGNAGTYEAGLSLVGLQGTSDHWIVFTSYGTGNKPRFDFTGFGDVFRLKKTTTANSARYVKFEGLSIYPSETYSSYNLPRYAFGCGSGQDGAGISDIEIRNCYIRNVGGGIALQSDAADIFNIVVVQDTFINTFGGIYFTGYAGMGTAVGFQGTNGYTDYNIRIDSNYFYNVPNHANVNSHEHAIYEHGNSRDYLIRYNVVEESVGDTMVSDGFAMAGTSKMTIANNTFTNLGFTGIGISGDQVNGGRTDSLYIYNNTFNNIAGDAIKLYQLSTYTGTILNHINIYNNKFYNNYTDIDFVNRAYFTNSLIANNTMVNWTFASIVLYAFPYGSAGTGNYFYNNIFANTSNSAPYYIGANITTAQIDNIFAGLDYNLYYRTSGTSFWKRYDSGWNFLDEVTSFATWQSETSRDANGINGDDPLLVNIGTYDFHIQAGSPAINAGYDLSATFTTDFDGGTRSDWDIGMDEYGVP